MSVGDDLEIQITVELADNEPVRLDKYVADFLGNALQLTSRNIIVSRTQVAKLIEQGSVRLDDETITKPAYKLRGLEEIVVTLPENRQSELIPDASVPFSVIFEDQHILVLDKPPGVVVHPGAGNLYNTLCNGLVAYFGNKLQKIGDALRPGIVHRLDKDTSGLMVVAKTEKAFKHLTNQFLPPRTIKRSYLALVFELPAKLFLEPGYNDRGVISLPIGRHPIERTKMSIREVSSGGKEAKTYFTINKVLKRALLLEVSLETGRTHQIRVHLMAAGSPIVGDVVYGKIPGSISMSLRRKIEGFNRQALHANCLSFKHPETGYVVEFKSEMPTDMQELVEAFNS